MLAKIGRVAAVLQDFAIGRESAETVAAEVAALAGADQAMFITSTAMVENARPFAYFRLPPESRESYVRSFADRDPQLAALVAKFPRGTPQRLIVDDEVLPYAEFLRTDLFQDYYRHYDVHRFASMESTASGSDAVSMRLLLMRGAGRGMFDKEEQAMLNALWQHFDTAAMRYVARREQAHATLAAAFEDAADAVTILDADGAVRYANAAFESLRQALTRSGSRHWERPLQVLALAPLRTVFQAVLAETRESGLAARRCEFTLALAGRARRYLGLVSCVLTTAGVRSRPGARLFLVALRESQALHDERVAELRQRFRLTPAQARVLGGLAQGQDLAALAARFEVSIHTVRLHVKALLAKTGCRRQAQLVRLVEGSGSRGLRVLI